MELEGRIDAEDSPPPPPPKLDPTLPHAPSDVLNPQSFSQPPSPKQHVEQIGSLSPHANGASNALLTPPSVSTVVDDSIPPSSPSASSFKGKQNKKSNPFTDLVESEREYIDLLASIIRKVAGAWSRTNFPPKQLDAMFRGIESVYKANRGLLAKLKEIGPIPSSPKVLGDLLMRWIEDLDDPYTKYCTNFATGFDHWQHITSNDRLPAILAAVSATHPPQIASLSPTGEDSDSPSIWTLDALFAVPRTRLKYYKKLYARLLKSTQAGRSDHKLLTGAVDKLETLLGILAERESILVGLEGSDRRLGSSSPIDSGAPPPPPPEDKTRYWAEGTTSNATGSETTDERARESVGSSVPHTSLSSDARVSRDTDFSRAGGRTNSSATMSMPISDLERRLCTEMTLDIFTLKPRAVRLQMNPPSLPFTRTLRLSHNVEIYFTPRVAPDSPRVHTRGHIFLLTDLFLVCERMTPEERQRAQSRPDGQDYDMWLLYPPLAGKHLRVTESLETDNVLQIQIMKKETLMLHTESKASRDHMINEFRECIEAANLFSPRAGQPPPPPVPPIKSISQSVSDPVLHQRDLQLSSNMRPASSMSPNPQYSDQGKLRMNALDHSRHGSFSTQPNTRQSSADRMAMEAKGTLPSLNVSSVDPRGGQMPVSSFSQPQIQLLSPPVHQFPYVPPGAAGQSHHLVPMDTPVRPSTAPGGPQAGGPSLQPNNPGQYPPRMPYSGPAQPGSYPNGDSFSPSPQRPPSDPTETARLRKSPSAHSLGSYSAEAPPPIPGYPTHIHTQSQGGFPPRVGSVNFSAMPHVHQPLPRVPLPPSVTFNQRGNSFAVSSSWSPSTREPSPPNSPPFEETPVPQGPVTSTITAQFKCKVFLKLDHGQWKSLGGARLKLYLQQPTNVKQLVAEADSKDKTMLISTIVLTDGVERVGKTGVAIELSDKGARTGIVYMIQLRNETSASGLFNSLLAGSDRAAGRTGYA